jgi:hypothetical protein
MFEDLRWITPLPPEIVEAIIAYELTREFYREVKYREEHKRYCQWYYETAEKHRQELQRMQGDVNILGWFNSWLH